MDEEDIVKKEHDVLDNHRIRNIYLDSSGLIFSRARAVKRVKIEQLPDDEAQELDHQLDANHQPGSSSQKPSHQDTLDSFNIQIKQELCEYEYLSDCNDINKADNSDQADNIDRSENNIDQTGIFIKPDNADSDFNVDGSDTADHSDIDGSDNLDQVSDFIQVKSNIISSHTSDIEIISSDTEYQLTNKMILGSKKSTQKTEVGNEHKKANVLLEDYGESLLQNGLSCDTCKNKFATPDALDAHKTSVHSFPVAVSRNVARKSTSKSYMSKSNVFKSAVAKISTGGKFNSRFCNHCHTYFSDYTSLKKHRYELLKQFSCNNCNLKFTTQNELTVHSIEHKELPFPKLVKVTKHLPVIYPNIDNSKLSNNVSVIYPKIDKTKLSKANWLTVNKNDDTFRCTLCSEIFDNYNNCKKHRDTAHPDTKNCNIFTKFRAKKRKNEVINDTNVDMIPKSTLFKCKNCNFHFLSGITAVLHKVCNIVKNFWLCGICNRKFRKEDQNLHKKQHEVNTRFRVHLIVSDLYHRILCRCPHCSLHFEEKQFKPHLKYCTKITKEMCSTCKILLPKSSLAEHTRKHVYFHFQPADFFILNYITEKHKRKSHDDLNETAAKTRKLNDEEFRNKVVVYYCKNCKCCVSSKKPIIRESHATKRCSNNAKICRECGLYFTSKAISSHSQYHSGRNITIRDIKMIDIVTLKVITPVIPNYPQCGKCKINFFSMEAKDYHKCGEDYETCEFCGDRYHNSVYDIHRLFHDEYTPGANNVNLKTNNADSFTTKKHCNVTFFGLNEINQNKKKYIRYHCVRCNLTMSRASLRSHKCPETVNKKKYHCNICNQIIVKRRKAEHIKKHKDFPDFIPENIQIKKFKSRGFKQDVIKDRYPSNEEEIDSHNEEEIDFHNEEEIDSHNEEEIDSHYEKEKVLEDYSKKYTVLKCVECNMSRDVKSYDNNHRCVYDARQKLHCKICDLIILKWNKIKHLAKHNIDPNFRKENIHIMPFRPNQSLSEKLSFAENEDDIVDESMNVDFNQDYEEYVANQQKTNPNINKYNYVQYECTLCKRNLLHMRNVRNHNCTLKTKERNVDFYCSLCKRFYPTILKLKHKLRHDSDPDYCADNIDLSIFCNIIYAFDVDDNMESINGREIENIDGKKIKYIQYECTKCKGNLLQKGSTMDHNCTTKGRNNRYKTFFCDVCERSYSLAHQSGHEMRHKSYPDYNSDTIQVVPFCNDTDDDDELGDDDTKDVTSSIDDQETAHLPVNNQEVDLQASIVSQENDLQASIDGQEIEIKGEKKLKYVQYECTICKVNLSRSDVIKDHNCTSIKFKNFYKTFFCNICKLYYSLKIKSSHILRHKTRPDYNTDTIKVMPFCNKNYDDSIDGDGDDNADHNEDDNADDNAELASSIDDQETEHQSVDDQEVDLRASRDGQETKNIGGKKYRRTQYQCTICEGITLRMEIVQHHNSTLKLVQEHNCTKCGFWTDNTFFCRICRLCYPTKCESSHRLRHIAIPDYKPETIQIVPYCNNETKDDDDTVDPSVDIDDQDTVTDKVIDKVETIDTNTEEEYIQYECIICNVNLFYLDHLEEVQHDCLYEKEFPRFFCDICDRSYYCSSRHELRHKRFKNYNANTIRVIPFDPQENNMYKKFNFKVDATFYDGEITKRTYSKTDGDSASTIYRCHCYWRRHFISMKPVKSNPSCSSRRRVPYELVVPANVYLQY